ncbi:DNA-directed RNA polymerase II subunit RPB9 [Trichinella pseudospiralis]|uniref:DNA-directed RNA polymerase II subunit RPB9 n=1 Tax=Trichinella pseudospiralis TaxID=6337 RepID=A0A0V1E1K0_TRIPS|nr:DNA-directed RNA polymerase II subunit RPB9 [Trichinella pseudospiralis]KRZ24740.1 DNA-directed RNA polymerase II subunit RPB9 [Trichinella pseudospiralis]
MQEAEEVPDKIVEQKSHVDVLKHPGIIFCPECNNILYPKEDKTRRCLLYACRNCPYVTDEIISVCVYTNKLRREIDELAQVNVDVIYDPTLPKTDDHSCPLCNNSEAVFFQSQNTKAEVMLCLQII